MTEELKACRCAMQPDFSIVKEYSTNLYRVQCFTCDRKTEKYPTLDEAITAWNTRAGEKA